MTVPWLIGLSKVGDTKVLSVKSILAKAKASATWPCHIETETIWPASMMVTSLIEAWATPTPPRAIKPTAEVAAKAAKYFERGMTLLGKFRQITRRWPR
jgi:hypothetical protein